MPRLPLTALHDWSYGQFSSVRHPHVAETVRSTALSWSAAMNCAG